MSDERSGVSPGGNAGGASRRAFLASGAIGVAAAAFNRVCAAEPSAEPHPARPPARKIPVIDCTDLYHPHQDVGDSFDIIAPYALPALYTGFRVP